MGIEQESAFKDRRLRVALAIDAMHPGGMAVFVLRLGEELQRLGFDVEVVTLDTRGEWFSQLKARNLPARHLGPRGSWIPCYRQLHVFRVARFFRGRYDAVILNQAQYLQAGLGLLSPWQVAIPVINSDSPGYYRIGLANAGQWDAVVAVSGRVQDACRKYAAGKRAEMIHYGIEIPSREDTALRCPHGMPFKLLYLGRLDSEQKNVLALVDVMRDGRLQSLDVRLTVVGEGPERGRLRALFEQSNLMSRVEFRPFCSPLMVGEYYLQHHVLLMPSHHEGFGMVLTEAQSHGCVPVANRLVGVTDEAVLHEETGLLIDGNQIDQYAAAIARLYNDAECWMRMSLRGRDYSAQHFSRARMAEEYAKLIRVLETEKKTNGASRRCRPWLDFDAFLTREYLPRWGVWLWEFLKGFVLSRKKLQKENAE